MNNTLTPTTTPDVATLPVVTQSDLLDPNGEYTEEQVSHAIVVSAQASAASDWVNTYGTLPMSGQEATRFRALTYIFINRARAAYMSDPSATVGERLHDMAFAMALLLIRRSEHRALREGRASLS